MSRKVNDGDQTGYKQDKFKHSRFDRDNRNLYEEYNRGVSRRSINTIGGMFNDNRGRRSDEMNPRSKWDGSPYDDGEMYNWNKRSGWDDYYNQRFDRGNRNHGGALIGHDQAIQGHRGRGPRGYKRSDESIYDDVCVMLSRSPDVDASNIEVSVKDGIVFLKGAVSDRESKKMAELEIENISGVIDVQNLLSFNSSNKDFH